ncbi:methyltransferase domain-containing protein [Colletotrichum filicis]|nr:methyltransferase domain-containing protein [Colletotrichum filicis]
MGEDVDAVGDPGIGDGHRRRGEGAGATRNRTDHKERRRPSRTENTQDAHDSDEDDSDAGSDFSSVSVDELPPIRAYGHTYHGSGVLLMPNDESERARLEIQYQLFKLCLEGGLTAAKLPKDRPLNILDIGSGTEDVNHDWAREKDSLDFMYMRNLVGGGVSDWKALFRQASGDEPIASTAEEENYGRMTACCEFEVRFSEMAKIIGVDFDPMLKIPTMFSEVSFEKVAR